MNMQEKLGFTDEDIIQLVFNDINNGVSTTRIDETPSEDNFVTEEDRDWNDYVDRVEAASRKIEEMKTKEASEDNYE